jgi:hypothetical protein
VLQFAIVQDFCSALPSDPFFLDLNDEMPSLFEVFVFFQSSDDSTDMINAEISPESTSSTILKRAFSNTLMMSSNVGRSSGSVDGRDQIN